MKKLKLFAPAKVNLFLKTVSKRSDGYHELDTVFQALSVGDEITFTSRNDSKVKLTCSTNHLPSGPKNLVMKAAMLLKNVYSISEGVNIHLKKNLPIASGLGGGSSDAASTLIGLNQFFGIRLSERALLDLAASFGSDIPFFILQTAFAHGKGRGEVLKPILSSAKLHHVLITPRLKVLASDAYKGVHQAMLTQGGTSARMRTALKRNLLQNVAKSTFNTLEFVIETKFPVITQLKQDLIECGAQNAMLSGSGPTVFGLFASEKETKRAVAKLKMKHPNKFIAAASTYR